MSSMADIQNMYLGVVFGTLFLVAVIVSAVGFQIYCHFKDGDVDRELNDDE